ncbi:MAG TPA: hypothetical protein PKJ33_00085 [Alphaproteobacteria bacterium]|nr:hypothetical protein [Alphaproteobacteria bacterium]
MRKIAIFSIFMATFVVCANAEVPVQRRGQSVSQPSESTAQTPVSARAAVRPTSARSAVMPSATSSNVRTISARSAATPMSAPVVSARAGTMQKVINSGTAISGVNKNIIVDEACKQKYYGCMDSFCMIENTSGGRCLCSDRKAELDKVQVQIQALDAQSYKMATEGVEKIEMGSDADKVIASANNTANSLTTSNVTQKKTLDLSQWNQTDSDTMDQDIFAQREVSPVEGKTGNDLYSSVAELCSAQIPECSEDLAMIQLGYSQNIKSDCAAYENDLTKQKNSSTQKLATAQKALRDAALDSLRTANKYDLGQCTLAFEKCMTDTAGCKSDFTGCVGIAAAENAKMSSSSKSSMKMVDITGSNTKISVAASTMDALESKKPMCENITNSCVAVKDQVWNSFLRDVAPTLKTAELLAESNLRTNCISNISSCFQKACKDTIDPNDPDGSYDMCLSRPETVRSLCKVQIDPCVSAEPLILDYVYAKLSAMRVDSCTTEVKECFTNENTCGEDFHNCIGLDLSDIKKLCPIDKLVGCQKDGVLNNINDIDNIVQGIYLNIDNSLLDKCQKIVSEKMIEICGDTDNCTAFDDDDSIGTESLSSYKDNNGDYVIEGLVSYGNVKIERTKSSDTDVKFGKYEIDINDYKNHLLSSDSLTSRVVSSLQSTANKMNQKIAVLSQDAKIKMCIEGRDMTQIRGDGTNAVSTTSTARYPNLLDSSILAIMNSGLEKANKNYNKKYDKMVSEALENQNDDLKTAMCAAMASEPKSCKTYDSDGNCTAYEATSYADLFDDTSSKGVSGNDIYSMKYIISGAKMSDIISVASSGHSEWTQTDTKGNMIGKVSLTSVYSSSSNTCNITTVTTMCDTFKDVYSKSNTCSYGGLSFFGGGGCKGGGGILHIGGGRKRVTKKFEGVFCTKFKDPTTVTNGVQM